MNDILNPEAAAQSAANDLRDALDTSAAKTESAVAKLKMAATEKASQFKQIASDKTAEVRQAIGEKASHAKEIVAERAQLVRQKAHEGWDHSRARAKDLHETTETYVRENPTKSILTAFGVGLVVGILLRRR